MASPPWRLVAATVLAFAASLSATGAEAATNNTSITRWSSDADFRKGTLRGLSVSGGSLKIAKPVGVFSFADPYGDKKTRKFAYGDWTSPWVAPGFDSKSIIPSWNVGDAPNGTWIRVEMRAKTASTVGSWDATALWAYGTAGAHRTSGSAQTDDLTKLDVDTVLPNGATKISGWQVRMTLFRPNGAATTPRLDSVGAVAANYTTKSQAVSKTTMTASSSLRVAGSSQMIHRGQYPEWGGGGASWCSPTSTSMVLRYFRTGPKPADYKWSKYTDSFVVHAARYTYDARYDGAGNWPFNTAYAGRYGLDSFVTRFQDLRDAEAFIKKGLPVVASVRYAKGALTGAPVASSAGHLLVIVGFMKDGRVIVNDPAASSNSTVRRVYNRTQFEKAWLGGSGGVSYVIRPASKALPTDTVRW